MTTGSRIAATALLLSTVASVGAYAADMTFERALNVDKEPQNWLLHHQNYQGHRFSALKEINSNNVANLRLAFTIGLGGLQSRRPPRPGQPRGDAARRRRHDVRH